MIRRLLRRDADASRTEGRCSFCRRERAYERLVAGPAPALFICEECAQLSVETLEERAEPARSL